MFLCQLETYKEDFEIEKKEKEQLAQECCKLRRQLEVAQVENKAAVRQVRPH
jgi:ribosomal protein L29